jgi:hypothetical protein
MSWRRLGIIYSPKTSRPWSRSHAALPVPVKLRDDIFRVFFSTRDDRNRSSVGWADILLAEHPRILAEGEEPILSFTAPGHFDDSGVGIGSVVNGHGTAGDRMYYMGWNLSVLSPWRNSIGVAVGNFTVPMFERMYAGPIMDRAPGDPYTLSYPWVMRLAPYDWRMWYGSNIAWGESTADMQHVIKTANSTDGIHWTRESMPAVGFSYSGEYALARPCVLADGKGFRMWFATRGDRYRIGAAVSRDGQNWLRCDEDAGLQPGSSGWDSEMVCYPCVIRHENSLYLFYNGNAFGRDGFGLAVWEGSPI